jgi:hypothetical protein
MKSNFRADYRPFNSILRIKVHCKCLLKPLTTSNNCLIHLTSLPVLLGLPPTRCSHVIFSRTAILLANTQEYT